MSDRSGLSIFDDDNGNEGRDEATQVIPVSGARPRPPRALPVLAPACPVRTEPFPMVRRGGYDPAMVDRHMHAGRRREGRPDRQPRRGDQDTRVRAREEGRRPRDQIAENENPTYAGLGGRASEMLRLAEEQADEVLVQAKRPERRDPAPGRQGRRGAQGAGGPRRRGHAHGPAQGARRGPRPRPRRVEQERNQVRAEADDILAAAKREAEQLRLAAQQETNALRTGAKREAEQARAAADREVQEARRALAVEKERLTREAAEHHSTATAETQRLVQEAEQRAAGRRADAPARRARSRHAAAQDRAAGGRAAAQPRPPRGRADRRLRADPGQQLRQRRAGRGRA